MNELQQYTRRNDIEIKGVPEVAGENVLQLVTKTRMVMGVEMNTTDIDNCHRVGKKRNVNESRPIIVKFISHIKKQEFVKARKVRRNLCVRDI